MTINACANPTGVTFPQQQNVNSSCNPNSLQAVFQKLLESLRQKPSCPGSSAPSCPGSSSAEDEKTKLLKLLLAQMGTQQQRPACGAQPQGAQPRGA